MFARAAFGPYTGTMPKGPHGQKRPADVIGNAVKVMRIATGELTEDQDEPAAPPEVGREGGRARAAQLTAEQRSEIAKKAAAARWASKK